MISNFFLSGHLAPIQNQMDPDPYIYLKTPIHSSYSSISGKLHQLFQLHFGIYDDRLSYSPCNLASDAINWREKLFGLVAPVTCLNIGRDSGTRKHCAGTAKVTSPWRGLETTYDVVMTRYLDGHAPPISPYVRR